MKPMTPEELEKFIHQHLRGLPARRAPRSLESRVMAALEQQAMIPWYHKSWSYWPAAVRAGFLACATGVAGAAITAFYLMSQGVDPGAVASKAESHFEGLSRLYAVGLWIADYTGQVVGSIPPLWLYGGLAAFAALYAAFFGLGAVAYRALYRNN